MVPVCLRREWSIFGDFAMPWGCAAAKMIGHSWFCLVVRKSSACRIADVGCAVNTRAWRWWKCRHRMLGTHAIGLLTRQCTWYQVILTIILPHPWSWVFVRLATIYDTIIPGRVGIYSRIPLLARTEVKTSSLDVLRSSNVLCHRSGALQFVFQGFIFSWDFPCCAYICSSSTTLKVLSLGLGTL
jgi:hypothetical protein